MTEEIEQIKNAIIQIATPYGTGSGFYLKQYNLIVTNRHVVHGSNEIVISGHNFDKTVSTVLLRDPVHDLAFIKPPENLDLPQLKHTVESTLKTGDQIIAIGHPFGLSYTTTQGIISKEERVYKGIRYIQIDAAINPGNSGGPLINEKGEIVGVNSFIVEERENLGFAVSFRYVLDTIEEFKKCTGSLAVRCPSCSKVMTKESLDGSYCAGCGTKIDETEFNPRPYQPAGTQKIIEDILTQMGKDVRICRAGPNNWTVTEGSATISINFSDATRFVVGDAFICKLPSENIANIYEFLLRENYNLENVYFSINNQNIILSLIIFNADLTVASGSKLFKDLFEKADHYDDILLDEYNALQWSPDE